MRTRQVLACLAMWVAASMPSTDGSVSADESKPPSESDQTSKPANKPLQQLLVQLETAVRAYEEALNQQTDDQKTAQLLPTVARLELLQASLHADAERAAALRTSARSHLKWASDLTQAELTQAKTLFRSLPKFIDPKQEPEKLAQRRRAEASIMSLQLQLTTLMELEAETHPPDSNTRKESLNTVEKELEQFYRKHRVHVAGLYARLAQARCHQALGDHKAARGIVNELISLGANQQQRALRQIHNQALRLLFVSMNDELQDRASVIDRGTEWFQNASREERLTEAGAGIAWEVAHAMWRDSGQPELNESGTPIDPLRRRPRFAAPPQTLWLTLHVLRDIRGTSSRHAEDAARWQLELTELLK